MKPEKVFKIGSPLNEVYNYYKKNIDNSQILEALNIRSDEFFLFKLSSRRKY